MLFSFSIMGVIKTVKNQKNSKNETAKQQNCKTIQTFEL
jgi:hypothetical protein